MRDPLDRRRLSLCHFWLMYLDADAFRCIHARMRFNGIKRWMKSAERVLVDGAGQSRGFECCTSGKRAVMLKMYLRMQI